jgi:hypothetical protein
MARLWLFRSTAKIDPWASLRLTIGSMRVEPSSRWQTKTNQVRKTLFKLPTDRQMAVTALAVALVACGALGALEWSRRMPPTGYVSYGQYFANEQGDTSVYLRLPDKQGEYVDWFQWGYDAQDIPEPAWVKSEPLTAYGVPEGAVAVRLHIKAKAKVVTWATGTVIADLQVKVRPSGSLADPNEVVHAYSMKKEGAPNDYDGILSTEDLNHIVVDVPVGLDGRIEIFRHPTIIGAYANLDLAVYLAGYWKP